MCFLLQSFLSVHTSQDLTDNTSLSGKCTVFGSQYGCPSTYFIDNIIHILGSETGSLPHFFFPFTFSSTWNYIKLVNIRKLMMSRKYCFVMVSLFCL